MGNFNDLSPAENAARLARVGMLPGEVQHMDAQIKALEGFWASLARAQDMEPAGKIAGEPGNASLREDRVYESLPSSAVLQNAKSTVGEYIQVPKVYDASEDTP